MSSEEEVKEERKWEGKIGLGFYPPYLYQPWVNLSRPS
jgi:hypothetical protein